MSEPLGDLFAIDAAPDDTWHCDVCNKTIRVREGNNNIAQHKAGKPHQKALRRAQILGGEASGESGGGGGSVLGKRAAEGDPRVDQLRGMTAKGQKRSREETDTSLLGADLKCRDASTNAKSILNELVQQKGWRLSYAHERRGDGSEPEFQSTLTLEQPRAPDAPKRSFAGEWLKTKKLAEVSAAVAALQSLQGAGETADLGADGPQKLPPSRLRWILCQPQSGDQVLRLWAEHVRQFRASLSLSPRSVDVRARAPSAAPLARSLNCPSIGSRVRRL